MNFGQNAYRNPAQIAAAPGTSAAESVFEGSSAKTVAQGVSGGDGWHNQPIVLFSKESKLGLGIAILVICKAALGCKKWTQKHSPANRAL